MKQYARSNSCVYIYIYIDATSSSTIYDIPITIVIIIIMKSYVLPADVCVHFFFQSPEVECTGYS